MIFNNKHQPLPDTEIFEFTPSEREQIRSEEAFDSLRNIDQYLKLEKTMIKRDPLKNVMLRLTSEEYSRLNDARRWNNLGGLSDNQIVRKLLFDQLDQEEERHEPKQQRHTPAMGAA